MRLLAVLILSITAGCASAPKPRACEGDFHPINVPGKITDAPIQKKTTDAPIQKSTQPITKERNGPAS